MPDTSLPDEDGPASYKKLASMLREHAVDSSVSEVHGMICGLLCSETVVEGSNQGLAIFDGHKGTVPRDLKLSFLSVMTDLKSTLSDGQLEFTLLLADDDSIISERIESVVNWCRGYLSGLVEGGVKEFESLSPEANELVHDIIALSELEVDADDEPQEQQEQHITEIEEYLKIGVQYIYDELHTNVDVESPDSEDP